MTRRTALSALACALAAAALPAPVQAQPDIFGPQRSAWGPRLDTVGISAATRVLWRGHDAGAGARASAALGIWGRSVTAAGAWHVSAIADGMAVDARTGSGSRMAGALEVGRLLEECGTVLRLWAGGYRLFDAPGATTGAELGVHIDAIPIPWLPEVWPTVHLRASRATGPLEGTSLGALIRQELGLQQYALRLELGADTDDVARDDFAAPRWRAEGGIARGFGKWLAHVDGGAVRGGGATLGWTGAGLSWRF